MSISNYWYMHPEVFMLEHTSIYDPEVSMLEQTHIYDYTWNAVQIC